MSTVASKVQVYLLSITVLPQRKGINVRNLIRSIADELYGQHHQVNIVHKFKVSGEARVIAVAEVSVINELDRIVENLLNLGPLQIDSEPLLHYEKFARRLGVAEELLQPGPKLNNEDLYWMEVQLDYHGITYEKLLDIWKREAEAALAIRSKGDSALELYKGLAQRKAHVFLNQPDPDQLDNMTFQLPIFKEIGDNVQVKCKGLQILNESNAVNN